MKPIKIYAENIEQEALDQFQSAMDQDYSVQGALMPDAHTGYSLPIGGVVATDGVIVPAWVGYDIGCGMCAIPTTFKADEVRATASKIFQAIHRAIPTGFNINDSPTEDYELNPSNLTQEGKAVFDKKKGLRPLGSLGGGNHFIEIGETKEGTVFVIIHSGSRGLGHGLATLYMKRASGTGKASEGHFGFEVTSSDGQEYINDMNWTLEFALCNRKEMIVRVLVAMSKFCKGMGIWGNLINRNHNHAEKKGDLWIHRKGATHAEKGMMGVIPGNMRDGSFIVRGKGNPESLWSSSHGAGRVLGRKKAKEQLDVEEFKEAMKGIKASVGKDTLDESPMAYKDLFHVMALQRDLVEIEHYVQPIINVKG